MKRSRGTKPPARPATVTVRCGYCGREASVCNATGQWVCRDGSLRFGPTPTLRSRAGWRCVSSCDIESATAGSKP